MDKQRNIILAVVLTALVLFGWQAGVGYFYPQANKPQPVEQATPTAGSTGKPTREGGLTDSGEVALEQQDLKTALTGGNRVPIAAPGLSGSINLNGGVVDDLVINRHRETVKKDSGPVRIYSPAGTPAQQFARFGWVGQGVKAPGLDTPIVWTAPAGARLTPATPVTLTWDNGAGQLFTLTYRIDDNYLITVDQAVANKGPAPVTLQAFGVVNRTDRTASLDTWNVHSGPIGAFDGSVTFGTNYKDVVSAGNIDQAGKADWLGFTDVYWMSALAPVNTAAKGTFRSLGNQIFRADLVYDQKIVQPGQRLAVTTKLFAGAKEHNVLDAYEKAGIPNFGLSIDWGWFRWFEKPIFWLLTSLFKLVGNFGVAIILLTAIVRGIMFPVAQRGFASMAAMRAIQPKMKAIQERYKDDKQKQQLEIMALYKQEKVNPLAGCLPMFLQIPVFFALYKTLILAIEMRHQPFVFWIKDLSAPDPLHILNLFGLLPFDPPSYLAIGVLALLLGVTMYLQFKLNPAQMDPAQQQVFALMPWFMMFVMAPFASGLLVYWITSNLLTIAQQKFLYSRHPQLKAMAEKEAQDKARASERGKSKA
ncbi:membrane protein insertase YidC [Novosphingobium sp. ST904]|uniref:membrane protein insertase YidC n=1 Tax=Novosphingobium sp. ST904 TaxID=1684385 RepID=UPI0006C88E8C|nr:membrane protein insertase YidC [Novosphingobium sp. ST904]KPH60592.1 membrane protein insertase YidC [Novosphingobium sp. ST904]TCM39416.1 protein translocase subunit yidC [Novosphingobium sp. ST904]